MCGVAGAGGMVGVHIWSGEQSLGLKEMWEMWGLQQPRHRLKGLSLTGDFRKRTAGHSGHGPVPTGPPGSALLTQHTRGRPRGVPQMLRQCVKREGGRPGGWCSVDSGPWWPDRAGEKSSWGGDSRTVSRT